MTPSRWHYKSEIINLTLLPPTSFLRHSNSDITCLASTQLHREPDVIPLTSYLSNHTSGVIPLRSYLRHHTSDIISLPFCHSAILPLCHSAILPFCHSAFPPAFILCIISPSLLYRLFLFSVLPAFSYCNYAGPRRGRMHCCRVFESFHRRSTITFLSQFVTQ